MSALKPSRVFGSEKNPWQEALLPGLLSLGLYLATLAENYSVAHDSILYLLEVTKAPYFHSHHLLWHWLAAGWLKLWPGEAAVGLSVMSALCGAGTVFVSHLLLRKRLGLSRLVAWLGSGLIALSYGLWGYSLVIEVYAPALLLFALTGYEWLRPGSPRPWRLAGWHGLAILFHQSHVLLIPLLAFSLYRQNRKAAAAYLLGLVVSVGSPYLFALGYVGIETPAETWAWVTGFLQDEVYWEPPGKGTLIYPFVGLLRSFVGGHFLFGLPALQDRLAMSGQSLQDEAFLVEPLPSWGGYLLLGLSLLWGSIWLGLAVVGLRQRSQWAVTKKKQVLSLGLAFGSYVLFFLFWVPFNVEFWLPQLLLLWWAWLHVVSQLSKRWGLALLGGMLLGLGGINYVGTVHWLGQPERDYYRAQAQAWDEHTQTGDLVMLGQRWVHAAYAEAFLPVDALALVDFCSRQQADTTALDRLITQTLDRQGQVLLTPAALHPPLPHPELSQPQAQAFAYLLSRWQAKGTLLPTAFGPAVLLTNDPNNPAPD